MIIRLLLVAFFTASMAILTVFQEEVGRKISFVGFSIGLISMLDVMRNYKKVRLDRDRLIVWQLFRGEKSYDLKKIEEWQESSYRIRGKFKKSLILFFSGNKRLIVSNEDHQIEFEELDRYLRAHAISSYCVYE